MDVNLLRKLIDKLTDNWKERNVDIKKTINGLLNNKTNKNVIKSLSKAIKEDVFEDKNKAVLIVTVALIRRNLNCKKELHSLLKKYNLINLLYGGLIKLLDGKSKNFRIEINWNYSSFENNYEFIKRFSAPEYRKFIDLILASSILITEDAKKFEKLLIKDSSNLLMLNFLNGEENWTVSDEFIKILLKSDNCEMRRAIGFYMLLEPLERIRMDDLGSKKSNTNLNNKLNNFTEIFEDVPSEFKAEMLINYFLENKKASNIPIFLAKEMMKSELVDNLVIEIRSNKIRQLDDLYIILFIVKLVRIKENDGKSSKSKLYNSIFKKLKEFIKDDKGIYGWGNRNKFLFERIYIMLPNKYKKQLKNNILKIKSTLMVSELDRLVRFTIYLKDQRRDEILSGMLDVINMEKYS